MTDETQPFRLDKRHALVTGGASGIGEATVKELSSAGAFVWIADINPSTAAGRPHRPLKLNPASTQTAEPA